MGQVYIRTRIQLAARRFKSFSHKLGSTQNGSWRCIHRACSPRKVTQARAIVTGQDCSYFHYSARCRPGRLKTSSMLLMTSILSDSEVLLRPAMNLWHASHVVARVLVLADLAFDYRASRRGCWITIGREGTHSHCNCSRS